MPRGISKTPEATREKQRKAHEGKPKSEKTRKKMRKAKTGENNPMFGKKGKNNPNFGSYRSPKTKEKQRKAKEDKYDGVNNPNFKGVDHPRNYHYTYNGKVRAEVRERDNYSCMLCGKFWSGEGNKFHTHHIYGFEDNQLSCNIKKLILLCNSCHQKVHQDVDYYIPQFEIIVNQEFVICGT